jgi:hypothetical protein
LPNNLDQLLASPQFAEVVARLDALRLLAQERAFPLTLVALTIRNTTTNDEPLPDEVQARLLKRAEKLIGHAVRSRSEPDRYEDRLPDAVFLVDGTFFLVLVNAPRQHYLKPLGRIIAQLRDEAAHAADTVLFNYKGSLSIASAAWIPTAPVPTAVLIGKVLEATVMVQAAPQPDTYQRLGLLPSPHDEIHLYEYPWDSVT